MDDLRLTRDLVEHGLGYAEVARLARQGGLRRIRRGAYVVPRDGTDPRTAHRHLIGATLAQSGSDVVVSHVSAAVLHGLPVWNDDLERVHLTRNGTGGGNKRRWQHLHTSPLLADETVLIEGCAVTNLVRTAIDLGRGLTGFRSVPVADAVLARDVARAELEAGLVRARRWPGVAEARRMVAFADPRSESVGESCSRVVLDREGVPPPTLQFDVFDEQGLLAGRSDFCWEAERVLGEFDGKIKYTSLLRPGQSASDVVIAEKRREDALRNLGWDVVRWTWSDLKQPADLVRSLDRAFHRR